MRSKIFFIFLFFISISFPQSIELNDSVNTNYKRILRSYFTVGIGTSSNYLNFGTGIFFPVGENLLLGLRVNANFEVDEVLFKTPEEYFWDFDVELRYIPIITERFILAMGAGLGYSLAQKRGELLNTNLLLVQEYEEIHSSALSVLAEIEGSILLTDNFGISLSGYTLFADDRTFVRYQIGLFLCKALTIAP